MPEVLVFEFAAPDAVSIYNSVNEILSGGSDTVLVRRQPGRMHQSSGRLMFADPRGITTLRRTASR